MVVDTKKIETVAGLFLVMVAAMVMVLLRFRSRQNGGWRALLLEGSRAPSGRGRLCKAGSIVPDQIGGTTDQGGGNFIIILLTPAPADEHDGQSSGHDEHG